MAASTPLSDVGSSQNSPQTSRLCVACGICCNGTLHDEANLAPQEIFFAESLGLSVEIYPTQAAFRLPCPRWQNGQCGVYPIRPNVCCTYRCKLLRSLDAHEITLETALAHVTATKRMVGEIDAMMGEPTSSGSIWQRVKQFAERNGYVNESAQFDAAFPALKVKTSTLYGHLKRHFHLDKK
jgi:hypothetical protein